MCILCRDTKITCELLYCIIRYAADTRRWLQAQLVFRHSGSSSLLLMSTATHPSILWEKFALALYSGYRIPLLHTHLLYIVCFIDWSGLYFVCICVCICIYKPVIHSVCKEML